MQIKPFYCTLCGKCLANVLDSMDTQLPAPYYSYIVLLSLLAIIMIFIITSIMITTHLNEIVLLSLNHTEYLCN